MAIQINTDVQTADGFTVQPFAYLYIQIYAPGFSNCVIEYYKSESDFLSGKSPVNIPTLVNCFNAEITGEEFWGTELATVFHNKTIARIEEVTGPGTCTIVRE
jgi:hypothetical protein